MRLRVYRGDIAVVRGTGGLGAAVRTGSAWLIKPYPAVVNHIALINIGGELADAFVVEWDRRVRIVRMLPRFANSYVWIYRPKNVPSYVTNAVVHACEQQVGQRYGYGEFLPQLLDNFFLGGLNVFRRLNKIIPGSQCASGTAQAAASIGTVFREYGLGFGVAPYAATPHDIARYCADHPEKYELILGEHLGQFVAWERSTDG